MDKSFLVSGKCFVESFDIVGLKNLYNEIANFDQEYRLPIEFIYQQIFIHACRFNFIEAIKFLFSVYLNMDKIQRMALRQMFYYGKHMLGKEHHDWYTDYIIKKIRAN